MSIKTTVRKKYRYTGVRPHRIPGAFRVDWYDWQGCRRTKIVYATELEASQYRMQRLIEASQIKNGLKPIPKQQEIIITLEDLWSEFSKCYQLKVDAGSIQQVSKDRYSNSIQALFDFDPSICHKQINNFSAEDFEKFKIYRRRQDFSPNGINTNLRNLKTIFRYAIKTGLMKKSPMQDVSLIKSIDNDIRYLSEDELKKLNVTLISLNMEDPRQKDEYDLTMFYLLTGSRASEALYPNFTWSCIKDGKIIFPKTKTYKSRVIPLTDNVKKILESRKHIDGGPFKFTRDMVYNRITSIFKKAKIEDASTRTLRKSAGAIYYTATKDIFATSRFLGHSSVKVTETHYVGIMQSLQIEYSKSFDKKLMQMLVSDVLYVCYNNTANDHLRQLGIT